MNPLAASPSRAPRVAGLGHGWWRRALARQERLSWGGTGTKPAWVDTVEQAVRTALPPEALPPMPTWQEAFAIPLRPFLTGARDGLISAARGHLSPAQADLEATADSLAEALARRLATLAAQTMVHELGVARAAGRLTGRDGHDRFVDFIWQQCEPAALVTLFERYPVLARLLGTASLQATQTGAELLARFAADRTEVIGTLLGGFDPGPVVAITPGLGDQHRQGRSVTAVSFADGRTVIYKPRSLAASLLFGEVVAWLNERIPKARLRTVATVTRPGYGWVELVAPRPMSWPSEADLFYRRHGVLLAALYAMHATDMHCMNVIACGDQPVLIDVETLLHPTLPGPAAPANPGAAQNTAGHDTAGHDTPAQDTGDQETAAQDTGGHDTGAQDPAAAALAASVRRTGLLPYPVIGENGLTDQSGLGGDADGRCPDGVLDWDPPATDQTRLIRRRPPAAAVPGNRPRLGGETIDPADHEQALLDGFRLGYNAIAADRAGFARLIESRGDTEVRVLVRSTRGYARLLHESTHPDLLRDARDRDEAFTVLRRVSAAHPVRRALAGPELTDLWAGDIPLVTTRPQSRGLCTSAGQHLPGLLDRPALTCALDTISAMGEVDRNDQEWLISASLATHRKTGGGRRGAVPAQRPVAAAADPDRLLAAACGLADQIVARGISDSDRPGTAARLARVNWPGLQLVDDAHWMLLPMGAGLADGYLGVALFLAELASLTGIRRYTEVSRRAMRAVPHLLGVLASRPDLLATVGCGAAQGLGGISYGLARVATLLDDDEIRDWTKIAVELAATAADLPGPADWAEGMAGCLAAMTAVEAELGLGTAGALATMCADRLAALAERTDGRCAEDGADTNDGTNDGSCTGIGTSTNTNTNTNTNDGTTTNNDDSCDGTGLPPGFVTGPAGIAWALSKFAAATDDPRYRQAAERAARYETARLGTPRIDAARHEMARLGTTRSDAARHGTARHSATRHSTTRYDAAQSGTWSSQDKSQRIDRDGLTGAGSSPGWCRGTAGLLVAGLLAAGDRLDDARLEQAVQGFADRPVLRDLSLCHGELGVLDSLAVLAAAGGPALAPRAWRHRAGLALGVLRQNSRFCGTPGGVPTPGLLDGLAGVGHGLLRLGFAERVPSALFLAPTPTGSR